MKIAVTGATGFIGRYVMSALAAQDVDLVAVVRSESNISLLPPKAKIVRFDITNASNDCYQLLDEPDVLIHLAWGGLPNYRSLHHFEEQAFQYRFLKNLIQGGLKSVFVSGTCFEYGMQSGPLSEELPSSPNNPYGFAKDVLRKQLQFLQKDNDFSLTWGRLFYLFGEAQASTSLFPQLQNAVLKGDKVFNMSGGEQLRDFLSINEVASYIAQLSLISKNTGVVNICSGRPISVRKIVENWILSNGWEIKLNLGHYPYPDYEPLAFWGTQTKLNSYIQTSN